MRDYDNGEIDYGEDFNESDHDEFIQEREKSIRELREIHDPSEEEIDDFVSKWESKRMRDSQELSDRVFLQPNGQDRLPAMDNVMRDDILAKTANSNWSARLATSIITKEDDNRERKRLVTGASSLIRDEQEARAKTQLVNEQLEEKLDESCDLLSTERDKTRNLIQLGEATEDALDEKNKHFLFAVSFAVILAIVSIILAFLHFSSPEVEVDPNDISSDPEVAQLQQTVLQKDREIDDLNGNIGEMKADLDKTKADLDAAKKETEEANAQVDRLTNDQGGAVKDAQDEVNRLNNRVTELQNEVNRKDAEIRDKQNRIDTLQDNAANRPQIQPQTTTVTVTPPAGVN